MSISKRNQEDGVQESSESKALKNAVCFPTVQLPNIPDQSFVITQYGAVSDGLTDNTEAFKRTIAACSAAGGGKVVIPAGIWLTGPIVMKSGINLHAMAGALIMFSPVFEHYSLILSQFEGKSAVRSQSPIDGEGLEDIAITGEGIFDGNGEAWRPVKRQKLTAAQWEKQVASGGVVAANGEIWWPTAAAMNGEAEVQRLRRTGSYEVTEYIAVRDFLRPALVSLRNCQRILLDGPTFQNSPGWCLHPWGSEHVTVRNTSVRNPWFSQNGDGLDVESCRYVMVENCIFDVGDDAICLKSGKDEEGRKVGLPCEYVTIKGCNVYHGHGGFVIGSEMSGGVRHVHVSDCNFIGTDIGLRFKSARGRGGIVEDIVIEDIRMKNIALEAISFHLFYQGVEGSEGFDDSSYLVDEGTPIFRNVEIRNIRCAGASAAFLINGLSEMPLSQCRLQDVIIKSKRGIICRHGSGLDFRNIHLQIESGPLASFHDCMNVDIEEMDGSTEDSAVEQLIQITGTKSDRIRVKTA
ncbi:MAG: glycoside hydrolase family 28 protein [Candidatus Pristimantibacillus sp.]